MNFSEIEARMNAMMAQVFASGGGRDEKTMTELLGLRAIVAKEAADPEAPNELHMMVQSMDLMADMLSDPEQLATIAAMSTTPYDRPPEIFAAIDDCDISGVRTALQTWDVNQTHGEFRATALYRAMSCSTGTSLDIIWLLLDAGADPRKGISDKNVLHGLGFANLCGIRPADLAKIIRVCVERGADIEERSEKLQWTPLITAVSEWNDVAAEALLIAGADITARAGNVEGVIFSEAGCMVFANGHEPTLAVLERYARRH